MPCGSRPLVGSSSTSSRGWRSSARARPSRCRMPERVGPHRPPVHAAEPDPLQRLVDPARRACAAGPTGPIASNSARLARPDRWAYAAGPSTSAPTCGSTSPAARGIGRPSTSIVAARWPAPARAASARSSSCRTRWRRGSRRRRPRGRRGRARRRRAPCRNRLVSPWVRITAVAPAPSRTPAARSPAAASRVSSVTVPVTSQPPSSHSPVSSTPERPDRHHRALRHLPDPERAAQLLAQRRRLLPADRDRQDPGHALRRRPRRRPASRSDRASPADLCGRQERARTGWPRRRCRARSSKSRSAPAAR